MRWLMERPLPRLSIVAAAVALVVLVVVLLRSHEIGSGGRPASDGRTTPASVPSASPPPPASPTATPTPPQLAPVPTITPELPSDEAQAEATTIKFLAVYLTDPAGDTPAQLQARVRPFDTDALDTRMGQGGGSGTPGAASTGVVNSLLSTGLAPDGRLVLVANVSITQSGVSSSRYVELYLARQHGAWRVDEVSL